MNVRLNPKAVLYLAAGALSLAAMGTCSSCTNDSYHNKAKSQAVKYLNAYDLLKAERFADRQNNSDTDNGEAIAYWDSLLIEAKSKEAYAKGQQLIKDSIKCNHRRKEVFKAQLDTILPSNLPERIRNEYAKYTNAEEFIKVRNNAPNDFKTSFYSDRANSVHYWNLITMAHKQQEAYNKGMSDERANQNKPFKNLNLTPLGAYRASNADNTKETKAAIDAANSAITRDVIEKNTIIEAYKSLDK